MRLSDGMPEAASAFYIGKFGDRRLERIGAEFHKRIVEHETVCLRRLGGDRAGEVRFGRWLSNPQVTPEEITREGCMRTGKLAVGLHVLAIQDTTEINYQRHAGRVAGLGTVGNGVDAGLFIHPLLAVDAASGACLGLVHQHCWIRTEEAGRRKACLIEEKESYRWLQVAQTGKACLRDAALVTIVADRESDIYEEWARIPDAKTHLLTRMCHNRMLADGMRLYEILEAQPVVACYKLAVPARAGKRSAHVAQMEARYCEVDIGRPDHCKDKKARKSIALRAIEVKERTESVVGAEEAIHWRLLTTHRIDCVEDLLACVAWYCQRWQVEQLFRICKRQGLNLEASQVEEGRSLMKLACLGTQAAVRTMQLTMARDGQTDRPAEDVFDDVEIEVLQQLQPRLEGATSKQKNPHPETRLAWAAWSIARLGGWKGYASEARPGPITMIHGQQRFAAIVQGWSLAKMCA